MVMEDLEERALTTLTNQPLFWKRFVDDVSTTTKLVSTQTFLEHLNSIEPCIKFTIERESEGKTRGGTPLYGLYRYVRPQRVWFFSRFGHK